MAGELVPVVMVPRYTTFCGQTSFYTIAMDVTRYEIASLVAWRGPLVGTAPTFEVACEESTDGFVWATCGGTNVSAYDPGANTEGPITASLSRRYFRLKITLGGTNPVGTCWVTGSLVLRVA